MNHGSAASIFLLFFVSLVVPSCLSLEWVDSSVGLGFPADRLVGAYGQNFCQGDNLNTGEVFVGALDGGKCRIVVGELVLEAPQFKVLTASPGEKYRFVYSADAPSSAVSCGDDGDGSCFLGASIYGDGICEEGVGTVDADEGIVTTANRWDEAVKCPFVMYLVGGE